MATQTKPNFLKTHRDGSTPKTKFDSSVIKNRVVSQSQSQSQSIDSKHKFSTSTITTKVEGKGKSVLKTTTKTTTVKTREKKVYSLPGQKFDVPEEREPLRIFYESLSKQIPSSEMAEFWMMEHGMLSPERAKKAFEKKKRKQKETRVGTPVKSPPPPPSRPESSKRPHQLGQQSRGESSKKPQPSKNGDAKPNKRVSHDSDDDEDDFILSHKRRKG
ncbi:hypothetical protein QVD17_39634 [Tagetes erecta]|uniref:Uncharacterized protein n=1 Tax=Tagetes erecta TaxID=13708 RepID=A0AAD8JNW8_TARER|nr:hypothetical protein QVD17_39634 [Tagetes erecta]